MPNEEYEDFQYHVKLAEFRYFNALFFILEYLQNVILLDLHEYVSKCFNEDVAAIGSECRQQFHLEIPMYVLRS